MTIYQNQALTNLAARRARPAFLASSILPSLKVAKQTGVIYKKDVRDSRLQVPDTTRAPGTKPNPLYEENPTTVSYNIVDHSLSAMLPDEVKAQLDPAIQSEANKVESLYEALLLRKEIDLMAALTASVSSDAPTVKFDDYVTTTGEGSDPIAYLMEAYATIEDAVGATPNCLALDNAVARALSQHPKFQERAKYTLAPAQNVNGIAAMANLIAAVLGLEQVFVCNGALYNSAARGAATASMSRIWGETALLFYRENPSLEYAGLGVELKWDLPGVSAVNGVFVMQSRDDEAVADKFFVHDYYDQKIVNAGAGFLITDCLGGTPE